MRRQQNQTQLQIEHSDDDCTSSPSQILERVQSDRVTVTKPEEDRRRRTIIVEKKNGSYGFTLQSYGIHYKKEQEIEMITYVDYVDYDGPAYRAGMREGDVILSINGTDMEKADHKTLVNFIKMCDTRMRMVVLFEDCVRKVELHMRYIQLQRILQSKMTELEKLCLRERQLLEGKWKTHSLPARKKSSQARNNGDPMTPTQVTYSYCRPTVSTEDVAKVQQRQPTPPTLILAYQYLDPHYRYMLQPSTSSSGEYLLTFEQPRYKTEQQQHFIVKTPYDQQQQTQQQHHQKTTLKSNQTNGSMGLNKTRKVQEHCNSYTGHLCNPCMQPNNNADNTSLEAYDLASPCCDPHCVPSSRRKSRNHKEHRKRDSKTEETQTDPQDQEDAHQQVRSRPHSTSSQTQTHSSAPRRYFQFGAGLVSQCSLHSCTSSELSGVAPTTTGESSGSYTTSLSTDTLYWDGSCDITTARQLSVKSTTVKHEHQQRYTSLQQQQTQETNTYIQYNSVKPKSWDNLTTKAFGGYGFGYGYLDTSSGKCTSSSGKNAHTSRNANNNPKNQYSKSAIEKHSNNASQTQPQYTPHTHRKYFQATKSTESLLSVPKYSNEALSDSSLECLDSTSPGPESGDNRFFRSPRQSVVSPTDPHFGYYSTRRTQRPDYSRNTVVTTSSEATRL
ncbi:PDZ domain-containing protein [Oryctes borbonicus]|uniref:PDZ domain-containing protein n=1 Tax=Oryctes borbonicus TaxID=1629725 RepID=A0A0T6AWK7_9SCAR|nr:PDZ domain-containing protein [Oryctes borbonicus]